MKKITVILFMSLLTVSVFGQENHNKKITINDLSWMAGHWVGEAFGSECEEIWNPPSAETMIGTFKLYNGSKVAFYEIMMITIDSAGSVMKLKQFNADLTGWEEKEVVVTFPFKEVSENKIVFDGIAYHRFAEDSLLITVGSHNKDGTKSEEKIECHLKK